MKNEKVAMMVDDTVMAVKVGHGCEVVRVETCYMFSSVVFVTQKGLPCREIISQRY